MSHRPSISTRNNKYKITDKFIKYGERVVWQIISRETGVRGGWIEKEDNLSFEGDCWIADSAVVCDDAKISGNAQVHGEAIINGKAKVSENATVSGQARITESASIADHAFVSDKSTISGSAKLFENAVVSGNSGIFGLAKVHGNAEVRHSLIAGSSDVCGSAKIQLGQVYDDATVSGGWVFGRVYGHGKVSGGCVCTNASITGDAEIKSGKAREGEYSKGVLRLPDGEEEEQ